MYALANCMPLSRCAHSDLSSFFFFFFFYNSAKPGYNKIVSTLKKFFLNIIL